MDVLVCSLWYACSCSVLEPSQFYFDAKGHLRILDWTNAMERPHSSFATWTTKVSCGAPSTFKEQLISIDIGLKGAFGVLQRVRHDC